MFKAIFLLALMALLAQSLIPVDFIQSNDVVFFSEEDTQTLLGSPYTLISALKYKGKLIYPSSKTTQLSTTQDPFRVSVMMKRSFGYNFQGHNGMMTICRSDPTTGNLYLTLDPFDVGYQWIVFNLNGEVEYMLDKDGNPISIVDGVQPIGKDTARSTAKCYVSVAALLNKFGINDPCLFCKSVQAKKAALLDLYRTEIECFSEEEKASQPIQLAIYRQLELL